MQKIETNYNTAPFPCPYDSGKMASVNKLVGKHVGHQTAAPAKSIRRLSATTSDPAVDAVRGKHSRENIFCSAHPVASTTSSSPRLMKPVWHARPDALHTHVYPQPSTFAVHLRFAAGFLPRQHVWRTVAEAPPPRCCTHLFCPLVLSAPGK